MAKDEWQCEFCNEDFSSKELAIKHEKNCKHREDIEFKKWINAEISLLTTAIDLVKIKKVLKEYAEELGWETIVDKKGEVTSDGIRRFEVKIAPIGGKMSPEELRELKDKLIGFAVSITRDILYNGREISKEEFNKSMITAIYPSEDLKKIVVTTGPIILTSPIEKFVELEKNHYNLCDVAFGITLQWQKEKFESLLRSPKYWFGMNSAEKELLRLEITKIKKLGIK
jgi:hypothetical protein